jgi:hypothetical protein
VIIGVVNVQIGPEFHEHRGREPIDEDICILRRCRHMHNTNITKCNVLLKEVKIDLNMLGVLMLD